MAPKMWMVNGLLCILCEDEKAPAFQECTGNAIYMYGLCSSREVIMSYSYDEDKPGLVREVGRSLHRSRDTTLQKFDGNFVVATVADCSAVGLGWNRVQIHRAAFLALTLSGGVAKVYRTRRLTLYENSDVLSGLRELAKAAPSVETLVEEIASSDENQPMDEERWHRQAESAAVGVKSEEEQRMDVARAWQEAEADVKESDADEDALSKLRKVEKLVKSLKGEIFARRRSQCRSHKAHRHMHRSMGDQEQEQVLRPQLDAVMKTEESDIPHLDASRSVAFAKPELSSSEDEGPPHMPREKPPTTSAALVLAEGASTALAEREMGHVKAEDKDTRVVVGDEGHASATILRDLQSGLIGPDPALASWVRGKLTRQRRRLRSRAASPEASEPVQVKLVPAADVFLEKERPPPEPKQRRRKRRKTRRSSASESTCRSKRRKHHR